MIICNVSRATVRASAVMGGVCPSCITLPAVTYTVHKYVQQDNTSATTHKQVHKQQTKLSEHDLALPAGYPGISHHELAQGSSPPILGHHNSHHRWLFRRPLAHSDGWLEMFKPCAADCHPASRLRPDIQIVGATALPFHTVHIQ